MLNFHFFRVETKIGFLMWYYSILSGFISSITRNVAHPLWKIIWCISIKLKFKLAILILNCHHFGDMSSHNYVTKFKCLTTNKTTSSWIVRVGLSLRPLACPPWAQAAGWKCSDPLGFTCPRRVRALISTGCSSTYLKVAATCASLSLTLKVLKQMSLFQVLLGILCVFLPWG